MKHYWQHWLFIVLFTLGTSNLAYGEVKISGYLKVDSIYDLDQKSGDRINYTQIDTDDQGYSDQQIRFHARESRVRITSTNQISDMPIKTVIEWDFFGSGSNSPTNSEVVTNSVTPGLRHAYIEVGNWLVGQAWSNYVDVKSFPENLDFSNDTGQAFLRQGQIRYSYQLGKFYLSHALENPESDIVTTGLGAGTSVSQLDPLFDLTHRIIYQDEWGHVSLQLVSRAIKAGVSPGAASALTEPYLETETELAHGVGVSGRIHLGDRQQLRFHFSHGKGLGRYIQESARYTGYLTETESGYDLELLEAWGGYLGYQLRWSDSLRSNFNTGYVKVNWPDGSSDFLSAFKQPLKSYHSVHTNLIWSLSPETELGLEYSLAKRTDYLIRDNALTAQDTLIDEQSGFVRRIQASMKYRF
ncbi:porin [Paraneptunicella aestuarii]|uniref:DcaP family trimeric outer membrane transporter n=1 Tax=Paraneptunicella aestuarii TaxID=2831148 RepID=UPI001E3AF586|nr:DcaP family trimeric outer membrane transporter [Paraneptunicella aestuarii]UAA37887.1 porin [Paraneptunicella aestuarii]